jgi:hypothetical protein
LCINFHKKMGVVMMVCASFPFRNVCGCDGDISLPVVQCGEVECGLGVVGSEGEGPVVVVGRVEPF